MPVVELLSKPELLLDDELDEGAGAEYALLDGATYDDDGAEYTEEDVGVD